MTPKEERQALQAREWFSRSFKAMQRLYKKLEREREFVVRDTGVVDVRGLRAHMSRTSGFTTNKNVIGDIKEALINFFGLAFLAVFAVTVLAVCIWAVGYAL